MTTLHGWIVVDKPEGLSSAQAVSRIRRILHRQKIGHAGTLDPLASGVLPLALGEATKTVPYIMDDEKTYLFRATWGEERTTDDLEGTPTQTASTRPSLDDVEAILPGFRGTITQLPPLYSALKIQGMRACDRVRRGEEITLTPRSVHIHDLQILNHATDGSSTDFQVRCGKGTYVRSLARDMGRLLGSYGYAASIRRTKVGPFSLDHALSIETLANGDGFVVIRENMRPIQRVLDDIPALWLSPDQVCDLRFGRAILPPPMGAVSLVEGGRYLCLDQTDQVVAVVFEKMGRLHPHRVFVMTNE